VNLLIIHPYFPGQYQHLVAALAAAGAHRLVAIGAGPALRDLPPGVAYHPYPAPAAAPGLAPEVAAVAQAMARGRLVAELCQRLGRDGFQPDLICVHPGWGDGLFLKEVFPRAPQLHYCEFFHRFRGADLGFDPALPAGFDAYVATRAHNACSLLSLEDCDRGVSPTQWQRNLFPAHARDRITVIHDGIDTERVRPDARARLGLGPNLTLSPGDEVVTYVARRLEPYRGFPTFMRALPEILARRPRARALIVGADGVSYGPPGGAVSDRQALLSELGARLDRSRVHFLGTVDDARFLSVLQVSAVHVYLTYPFVLSWSMLEAMAAGCLVIGSRTAPVTEVIRDGENGRLVDFFQPAEVAAAAVEALAQPDRFQRLRADARRTVCERYSLNLCRPRLIGLIDQLALGSGRGKRFWD
jgi:glycosyltransferase involved in cell wall biosynthesis